MNDALNVVRGCDDPGTIPYRPYGRIGSARCSAEIGEGTAPRNTLLASLPEHDFARLRPRLERVPLRRRQILHERNGTVSDVYFIERGAVSLLSRVTGRDSLEVGTLGRDDLVGVSVVLGTAHAPHRCLVQVPGEALRIRADDLRCGMSESPVLQALLLAHVQAALVRSTQLVVCNTRHCLNERLARSLLVALEQLDGDEIPLTHRSLSRSLGVRRAGVTSALGDMEGAGLVRRGRGRLRVLDREGLEQVACECHRIIGSERKRSVFEAVTCRKAPPSEAIRSAKSVAKSPLLPRASALDGPARHAVSGCASAGRR